jgi:hypothetical protein
MNASDDVLNPLLTYILMRTDGKYQVQTIIKEVGDLSTIDPDTLDLATKELLSNMASGKDKFPGFLTGHTILLTPKDGQGNLSLPPANYVIGSSGEGANHSSAFFRIGEGVLIDLLAVGIVEFFRRLYNKFKENDKKLKEEMASEDKEVRNEEELPNEEISLTHGGYRWANALLDLHPDRVNNRVSTNQQPVANS